MLVVSMNGGNKQLIEMRSCPCVDDDDDCMQALTQVTGGQLFFVTGPLHKCPPTGPVVQMGEVKGSQLTSLQGSHTHLTTTGGPTYHLLLISPFFARPDKTGRVFPVDGQNMLIMSFPRRIFAKCGKTHIWTSG